MIHWIAGRERVVGGGGAEEDETRPEHCWGHLPSRGGHEAGDSKAGCAGERVHVDQGRVGEHGIGAGGTRRR